MPRLVYSDLLRLACFAPLLVGPSIVAGTTLIDDFSSGSDDLWAHGSSVLAGTGLWTVVNGEYILSTSAQIPASTSLQWVAAGCIESYDRSFSYSEGTLRAAFRLNNSRSNAAIVMRDDGTGGENQVSFFAINANPDIPGQVGITVTAKDATVAQDFVELSLDVGTWYQLEAKCAGSDFSVGVWPLGEPRPAQPTVSMSARQAPSLGGFALVVFNQPSDQGGEAGAISARFDTVVYTPPGAVAGDLDQNGVVDGADLGLLLGGWALPGTTDLNGDGTTDGADLGLLLSEWTVESLDR